MADLKFIFVHGLSGWGSYDRKNRRMPYWGMRSGDLIEQLGREGFACFSASVSPYGSAYDRACELYAQLAGTVTDYGIAHSQQYGHPRFGPDFTGKPLIPVFDEKTHLVLIGHSFGGATVRVFADILAHGRKEEQQEGSSPFFSGGCGNRIFALAVIASPLNGTTAYDLFEDASFDRSDVSVPLLEEYAGRLMSKNNTSDQPLPEGDSAAYDMHIDHALALNRTLSLSPDIYYFSQPCSITDCGKDGYHRPDRKHTEILFRRTSRFMGAYKGSTAGGFILDEAWRENDGLVNTVSAAYPFTDPHQMFDPAHTETGMWNVFAPLRADHMALQGDFCTDTTYFRITGNCSP